MTSINVSSLVNGPIRELRFPGFRNVFVIGKFRIESLPDFRYAIIDRYSMVILVDDCKLSMLIFKLVDLLDGKSQDELDDYISTLQEYNE